MGSNKTLKNRFHISVDELESRMQKQKKLHDKPAQKAVAILEAACDMVLKSLGVNYNLGDNTVAAQMDFLGIIMTENTEESTPQLNGFYFFKNVKKNIENGDNPIPWAWVGAAKTNHLGECSCEVHWFQKGRMDEVGKMKLA